jgi:hypothetical protein
MDIRNTFYEKLLITDLGRIIQKTVLGEPQNKAEIRIVKKARSKQQISQIVKHES